MILPLKRLAVLVSLMSVVHFAASAGPTISIWSGLNQSFGHVGNPQTAINILGNVSDANGVTSLSYKLNGGSSIPLSQGPDTRRLLSDGDFNIDISTSLLNAGANTVAISATNSLNATTNVTVNVNYTPNLVWPIPYVIDWSSAGTIGSVAQIVDGHWTLSGNTITPTTLGYDRLVAIGDRTWTDYEVTVPITIHGIDPIGGFGYPSNGPGVGLIFRWTGHTDDPIAGWQPKTGYLPFGAIGWYNWDCCDRNSPPVLRMVGNDLVGIGDAGSLSLAFDVAYYFKMRVETVSGQGSRYKLKVWQAGQSEPSVWTIESGIQPLSDPQNGSVLLVSHHVDAEFGTVVITDLSGSVPIQLSRFTATLQSNNLVRLNWSTSSETNNFGFEVQRANAGPQEFQTLPNSFIPGHGTTLEPQHYVFVDSTTATGTWLYRLKQIDLDGSIHYTEPVQISVVTAVREKRAPVFFFLYQNFPNPFNPTTLIQYEVPFATRVRLEVFNALGQAVATLVDDTKPAGLHAATFDASHLTSGIYLYRLTAGSFSSSRKLVLVK